MQLSNLLDPSRTLDYEVVVASKFSGGRGCSFCPLNDSGLKLKGLERVVGDRIMLWGDCPTAADLNDALEFSGNAGRIVWPILRLEGLDRRKVDTQNAVRCKLSSGISDKTLSDAVRCCGAYSDKAADGARVHLVFGEDAARWLLRNEFRKDRRALWSKRYGAYVVLTADRREVNGERLHRDVKAAIALAENPERYGYLRAQNYGAVTDLRIAREYVRKLRTFSGSVVWDLENLRDRLICFGFSHRSGFARSIFVDHDTLKFAGPDLEGLRQELAEYFADKKCSKSFHHGSSDVPVIEKWVDGKVRGYDHDTEYAAYFKDSGRKKYGLDYISNNDYLEFAGYKDITAEDDFLGREKNWERLPSVSPDLLALYNGADCDLTKRIEVDTKGAPGVPEPLIRTYIQCGFVVDRMEKRGPKLDYDYHKEVNAYLPTKLDRLTEKLRRIAQDDNFNPNAPDQVARLLYDRLTFKQTKFGRKTNEKALGLLRPKEQAHPAVQLIKDHRKYSKLKGTYLDAYLKVANANAGRLASAWWLTGAITGRLRSGGRKNKLNLQNIAGDPLIENMIVADTRWRRLADEKITPEDAVRRFGDTRVFLAPDYSQVEIRELAELSKDPLLIKQFKTGKDIHCQVGQNVTEYSFDEIKNNRDVRTMIKQFHFGMVFGLDEEGAYEFLLMKGVTGITKEGVAKVHRGYFRTYRKVKEFIINQRAFGKKHGYVETLFGFRRHIFKSREDDDRGTSPLNQCVNTPIQGTAHTLLLCAIASIKLYPKRYKLLQDLCMEVHDSLDFRVMLRHLSESYKLVKDLFEEQVPRYVKKIFGITLKVPLLAEAKAGPVYGIMNEYEGKSPVEFLTEWRESYKKNRKSNEVYAQAA